MNDTVTQPAAEGAKAPKIKTVIDDMDSRKIFDTTDDAAAYIAKCQSDFPDFNSYPAVTVGFTDDGAFDPAFYTDEMRVAVAVLTQRGEGPNTSTVKAIVIYPSPKLEAILTAEGGESWLTSIMEKELNHVAMRSLRKAEDEDAITEALPSLPKTIGEFITSGRETSSGILETYNQLWQVIKKGLGQKFKSFALANLSKKELRKAMESASYAATVYPHLETRKNKKGDKESYFEIAATFGAALAKQEGLDPAIFTKALEGRNEKTIEVGSDDEDDFDIEAMAIKLTAKPEEPAATGEATEATTQTVEPAAAE